MKSLPITDEQDHVVRLDLVRGQARVDAGSITADFRTPFFALAERIRASDVCDTCKKSRILLRLSARYVRETEERPDPSVHCSCNPGGPAWVGARYIEGATVTARHQLIYFEGRDNTMRYIAEGTHGVITKIEGPIASVVFDGHPKPYLHNTIRLDTIVELSPTPDGGLL
jgi:hypothetical protein